MWGSAGCSQGGSPCGFRKVFWRGKNQQQELEPAQTLHPPGHAPLPCQRPLRLQASRQWVGRPEKGLPAFQAESTLID